jgi:hypothetical protein
MYSIYQLYLMNQKKLPFEIKRYSWGNLFITVDKIDNIRYSASSWYCDAYTLSEQYNDSGYGSVDGYKVIGCAGCYQWEFADADKEYNPELLTVAKQHHKNGLVYKKAAKDYICYYCKKEISKGTNYERYSVKSAGNKAFPINEVFCLGHRDEMREIYFNKPIGKIKFQELIDTWNKGIVI